MSLLARTSAAVTDERGGVLVMFALFAPVAILFVALAIDVSNTFVHARHLQLQADASALAAAQEFQPCNNAAIEAIEIMIRETEDRLAEIESGSDRPS